jgi:prepilin-type processing-associated H-X9-DG protein
MYCPKCGFDNPEDEKNCKACSAPLPQIPDLPPPVHTSKLAIWSFVLSMMGLFTFMVTALPAIICGIIGLVKISGSKGLLKGKGYAITGIVTPFVYMIIIFFVAMFAAISLPAVSRARDVARTTVCSTNLKTLGLAILTYTKDNNDVYPPAENWTGALAKYVPNREIFRCPASDAQEGLSSYAYNINAAGKHISEIPPDTVILFETTPAKDPIGSYEILKADSHGGRGFNVLFADGHVEFIEFVDSDKQSSLRWKIENP